MSGYEAMDQDSTGNRDGYSGTTFGVDEGIAAKQAGLAVARATEQGVVSPEPGWQDQLKANLPPQSGGTNQRDF